MSFIHLSLSSNSGEKKNQGSFTSFLNLQNDTNNSSNINSDIEFSGYDSFRKNNSLLFNRESKNNQFEQVIEPAIPNDFNNWFRGFEQSMDLPFLTIVQKKQELEEKDKPEKSTDNAITGIKNGFRFLKTKVDSPGFELRQFLPVENNTIKSHQQFSTINVESSIHNPSPIRLTNVIVSESSERDDIQENEKIKKPKTYKSELIKGFEKFLFKMFTSRSISESDFTLNNHQEEILQAILHRKFGKCLTKEQKQASIKVRVKMINEIVATSCKKRPEECYKYFLIRIIKWMKEKLGSEILRKGTEDDDFYEYYFGEVAKINSIRVQEFYYPFKKKADKEAKLNSKYFQRIKMSSLFLDHVREFFEHGILKEHYIEVQQKLFSLLKPQDQLIRKKKKSDFECKTDLIDYIQTNRHCKFPWTLKELNESIEKFKMVIF